MLVQIEDDALQPILKKILQSSFRLATLTYTLKCVGIVAFCFDLRQFNPTASTLIFPKTRKLLAD